MKAAVIAKPSFRTTYESSKNLIDILSMFDSLYVFSEFGGEQFVKELTNTIKMPKLSTQKYVERFNEIVGLLVEKKVGILITVGGDGIASYSASSIISQKADITILGYPAGTANIGPIVQKEITRESFNISECLDSIKVSCKGKVLGYGFNDVVFGSSLLGTLNGKMVNINANKLSKEGLNIECVPAEKVVKDSFEMCLNGNRVDVSSMQGRIAQICVSTLHQDNINGRAIFGGLGESLGYEHPAAIALLDKVSVDARPETWNCQVLRTTAHLSFCEKDTITLKGFEENICVIIDGNPFMIDEDEITVQCIPDSIRVLGYRR